MGPTVSVIFEKKPSIELSKSLETQLSELGSSLDFYFYYADSQYWQYSDEDIFAIKETTSMSVCGAFSIATPCNGAEDHRNLGKAALIASKHLSGLIDFGGAIVPELPDSMKKGMWIWEQANWSDIEPYFMKMISTINGKIYTIEYKAINNKTWANHICDVEFLGNWLNHPKFHMIK